MTRGAITGDDIAFTAEDEANMRELIDAAKQASRGNFVTPYGFMYGMALTAGGIATLEQKATHLRGVLNEAATLMNELARDGVEVSFSISRNEDDGYVSRVKITKVTEL